MKDGQMDGQMHRPSSANYAGTHQFNGPLSGTTQVSRYQKGTGKTNLDFTKARDSEWQWHQLGHMHVCTSLQTDNQASTPPLSFLQAGCPSCRPTNSVKALKANCKLCGQCQQYEKRLTITPDVTFVSENSMPYTLNGQPLNRHLKPKN